MEATMDGRQMLGRLGLLGVRYAKQNVHRRTGNLGRTIRLGSVSDSHVEVKAGGQRNVGYAAAEERGARPHVILPKRAKVLAWGGSRTLGGGLRAGSSPTHFARRVNHPGQQPHPFLVPGVLKAAREQGADVIVELWNGAA